MDPQQTDQPQPTVPPQSPPLPIPTQVPVLPKPGPKKGLFLILGILVIGLIAGSYYLVVGKSKSQPVSTQTQSPQLSPSPTPDLTADWKTYTTDYYKIKLPSNWTSEGSFYYDDNKQNSFIVALNMFDEYGVPSCEVKSFPTIISGKKTTKSIYAFCKESRNSKSEECGNKNCRYSIFSNICLDNNFKIYEGPCEYFVKNNNYYYYQLFLDCNRNQDYSLTKNECSVLFDQILSTFKFLE